MEGADVELVAQRLLGSRAQRQDLQLAGLVRQRLPGPGDVAVGLGLHVGLVLAGMGVEEIDHLLARPVLVVHTGVEHQAIGAQQLIGQAAVVGQRVLVEAHLLAQLLGIQRPALDIGGVAGLLAERRQLGQALRDRDLQVMARNALVVGGGFDGQHAAVGEIAGVDEDLPGPRAVRRALMVFGRRGLLLAELLHRLDHNLGLGQAPEQFGQLRLHAGDVAAIAVEDVLARGGVRLRIGLQRGAETGQVLEALRVGDLGHLALDALDLGQADLVDLLRGLVGGGHLLDLEAVDRLAIGQVPHAGLAAPVRRVVVGDKLAQLRVGGAHVVVDRGEDGVIQALLVGRRDRFGEMLQRLGEHAVHAGRLLDAGDLLDHFFQQVLRRHHLVGHALARHRSDLVEQRRHRLQARQVVVVLLGAVERDRADEAGQRDVHAAHLVQRHLVELEVVGAQRVLQLAHHQLLVQLVAVGKAAGVDRLEALEEILGRLMVGLQMRQRGIAPAIVVAQVAEDGGELGAVLQRVLPLLGEQRVEGLHATGHVALGDGLRGGRRLQRSGQGHRAREGQADQQRQGFHRQRPLGRGEWMGWIVIASRGGQPVPECMEPGMENREWRTGKAKA